MSSFILTIKQTIFRIKKLHQGFGILLKFNSFHYDFFENLIFVKELKFPYLQTKA